MRKFKARLLCLAASAYLVAGGCALCDVPLIGDLLDALGACTENGAA